MTTKVGDNWQVSGDATISGDLLSSAMVRFPGLSPAGGTRVVSAGGMLGLEVSSIRYKVDVEDLLPEIYNKVLQLRPVWFRSNEETVAIPYGKGRWSYIGLIAEEVAEVEERLVNFEENDRGEYIPQSVDYSKIGVMLIPIVRKLLDRISSLESRLSHLERKDAMYGSTGSPRRF